MSATTTTHPDSRTLTAFALGKLNESDRAIVERHVETCGDCCDALARMESDSLLDLARDAMKTVPMVAGETTPITPDVPPDLMSHPRYRILGKLGAGGMGVVYRAEHRMMGRIVALKVLNAQTIAKPGALERFHREVKLASRLSHTNIVTAFDADTAGSLHFLVMEYVDGVSLDRLVGKKGPLPVVMACQFARLAALGLQHAHEKGMIHRDIKPHNLMVSKKGQLKILDFGLARVARTDDTPTSDTMATVTSPEIVLGTPDFLAPEQAQSGRTVDARVDQYSLGCTLFYLLTGRPPFDGTTPMEKLIRHVTDAPPDVRTLRPEVPAELAAIITKLMAKTPNERFPSANDLATVLQPFTKAATTSGPQLTPVVLDAEPFVFGEPGEEVPDGDTVVENRVEDTPTETRKPRRKKAKRSWASRHRVPLIAASAAALLLPLLVWGGMKAASLLRRGEDPIRTAATNRTPVIPPPFSNDRPVRQTPVVGNEAPKIVIVVPPRGLWYPDYGPLRQRLEAGGAKVAVAGMTRQPVAPLAGAPGEPVTPDRVLSTMTGDEADAIIFIGFDVNDYVVGPPSDAVRRVVNRMIERKKIVSAICAGVRVLAELDYLQGRTAAYPTVAQGRLPRNLAREWTTATTVDGRIVTAPNDQFAVDFADKVLETLKSSP